MSGCRIVSRKGSHVGLVRERNEDAVLALANAGLWAVADGMGGHRHGEQASRAIVESLETLAGEYRGEQLVDVIPRTLKGVNSQLQEAAAKLGGGAIIGSTVVALVLEADNYHCFWAGDSRIYLWRDQNLRQLTRDHVERSGHAPARLTRAVGAYDHLELDYCTDYLYEGDVFLLCSDGLTNMLSEGQLRELLSGSTTFELCEALLAAALRAGGKDNVSCVTVALVPQPY